MNKFMRCKFQVHTVKHVGGNDQPGVLVEMGAVYEADEKKRNDPANENSIFGKYTPHGSFAATIYNPNLVKLLPSLLGKQIYLDFTVAE